jgi:hypothetical protein
MIYICQGHLENSVIFNWCFGGCIRRFLRPTEAGGQPSSLSTAFQGGAEEHPEAELLFLFISQFWP